MRPFVLAAVGRSRRGRRRALVGAASLLALVLLVSAVPAMAQPGKSPTTPPTPASHGRGEDRTEGTPAVGSFEVQSSTRHVSGEFVSFSYDDATATDFSVAGVELFDLRVEGASDDTQAGAEARGSEVSVETPNYRLKAHDNPVGVTRIETDGDLFLTFVAGTTLTLVGERSASFAAGSVSGNVRGKDLRIEGTTLHAKDQVLIVLDNPHGTFDAHRGDVNDAVAKGHVGAEASFSHGGGDDVSEDIVSYGNVTLSTLKAEKGNLTILIDGHGTDGRVLVLNVDGRVVGASKAHDLSVLFDNFTIHNAATIEDVLDPDDDGPFAEYYVVFDPSAESFQLLLSVPHYSVHTLSITTLIPIPPPSVIVGLIVGVAILAPSAAVLFRRAKP